MEQELRLANEKSLQHGDAVAALDEIKSELTQERAAHQQALAALEDQSCQQQADYKAEIARLSQTLELTQQECASSAAKSVQAQSRFEASLCHMEKEYAKQSKQLESQQQEAVLEHQKKYDRMSWQYVSPLF